MSDKRINKIAKRFMDKRPFKLVYSFKEANVLLFFYRNTSFTLADRGKNCQVSLYLATRPRLTKFCM